MLLGIQEAVDSPRWPTLDVVVVDAVLVEACELLPHRCKVRCQQGVSVDDYLERLISVVKLSLKVIDLGLNVVVLDFCEAKVK